MAARRVGTNEAEDRRKNSVTALEVLFSSPHQRQVETHATLLIDTVQHVRKDLAPVCLNGVQQWASVDPLEVTKKAQARQALGHHEPAFKSCSCWKHASSISAW